MASNELNVTRMFDLQPGGQMTELVLETTPPDHGQVGVGCQIKKGRHRCDQTMVPLVPLEPSHRAHQRRARHIGNRVADREGLCSIADEPDPLRFESESSSEESRPRSDIPPPNPSSGGAEVAGLATVPP